VAVAATLAVLLAAFVPRVPSRALAVAGGVATAGALGNLVSAVVWRGGVPNPIVLGDVAFNIADVYAVGGSIALVLGATLFALRHPALLRQPSRPIGPSRRHRPFWRKQARPGDTTGV